MAAVPKPGKPLTQLSGYRSIALQEPAFKALAKAMRGSLEKSLRHVATPGLSGGRKGSPMAVTAMTVQAHVDKLKRLHRSGAVLFLDGVSAFYSTARHFLFPPGEQADVQGWIDSLPIRPGLKDKLVALLQGPSQLARMDVAQSIQHTLASTFAATWFTTITDHGKVFRTSAGTIPGSPLADVLFQAVMVIASDEMLTNLETEGMRIVLHNRLTTFEVQVAKAPLPTWLDDVAILLESQDASSLPLIVARATRIAHEAMQMINVHLNFQPGKTEAILHFAGQGAKAVRQAVLVEQRALIPVDLEQETVWLRCVPCYLHLGTTASFDGHHTEDIRRRKQLTEAAFQPLYNRLLFSQWLSHVEKVMLVQSLILSKFTHGAGLWRLDRQAAWQAFHAAYMSFVRRAVRPITGVTSMFMSDSDACVVVGCLGPADALCCAQSRQLLQLAASNDAFLWGTAIQAKGWLDAAADSLLRVSQVTGEVSIPPLPCDEQGRFGWFLSGVASQVDAKIVLRKFKKQRVHENQAMQAKALNRAQALNTLEEHGAVVLSVPDGHGGSVRGQVECELCGHKFWDARAKASHKAKSHGVPAAATSVAVGTCCEVCGTQFWTTSRLKDHLRKAERCLRVYLEADITSSGADAGRTANRSLDKLPAMPLIGPKQWWATLAPEKSCPQLQTRQSRQDTVTTLSEAQVQDELEAVRLDALAGPRLVALKFAQHVVSSESDDVVVKGHLWIYLGGPAKAFAEIAQALHSI